MQDLLKKITRSSLFYLILSCFTVVSLTASHYFEMLYLLLSLKHADDREVSPEEFITMMNRTRFHH